MDLHHLYRDTKPASYYIDQLANALHMQFFGKTCVLDGFNNPPTRDNIPWAKTHTVNDKTKLRSRVGGFTDIPLNSQTQGLVSAICVQPLIEKIRFF